MNQHRIQVAISLLSNSVFVAASQVRLALVGATLIEVGTHAIAVGIFVEKNGCLACHSIFVVVSKLTYIVFAPTLPLA